MMLYTGKIWQQLSGLTAELAFLSR